MNNRTEYFRKYRKTKKYKSYKKRYNQRPNVKAYKRAYSKLYFKARMILIENHKIEFAKLVKELKECKGK